jgi:hypothetical protein
MPNLLPRNRKARRRAAALARRSRAAHAPLQPDRRKVLAGSVRLSLTASAQIIEPAEGIESLPSFQLDAYSGGEMHPQIEGIDWDGGVVIDISGIKAASPIPVHRDHDTSKPVGHASVELAERVRCQGVFSVPTVDSWEILDGARNGFPWKASVGLSNMQVEFLDPGQTATVNGRDWPGPMMIVRSADLDEVSIVTIPGDKNVGAVLAASQSQDATNMKFTKWLAANGFDSATLTAQQRKVLHAQFIRAMADNKAADEEETVEGEGDDEEETVEGEGDEEETVEGEGDEEETVEGEAEEEEAMQGKAKARRKAKQNIRAGRAKGKPVDATIRAARARAAAEVQRCDDIREVCDRFGNPQHSRGVSLAAHAIADGWSASRVALHATRTSRPRVPAIHATGHDARCTLETLQAGVMLRAGRPVDRVLRAGGAVAGWMTRPVNDPDRQRIMDNAHEFRDVPMIEQCSLALRATGQDVPSGRNPQAILRAAFATGAVTALYETSIGSMAIASYQETQDFSQGWTTTTDALNLEAATRVRMSAANDLSIHPESGTAEAARPDAAAETVQVSRFSRQAPIDEIAFINDRFGLLRDIPLQFGQAAARVRPTLVASILLANAAMRDGTALFHANHGNVVTSSALAQATLRAARAKLAVQKDGDANLNLQASHLITPQELADLGFQLTQSAVLFQDAGQGGANPIRNVTPIAESRLDTGLVHPVTGTALAGSLTTWYIVSKDGHTIEVQYLAGTGQVPIITVEQMVGGQFGINATCKHYVGAKALDWRSMVRGTA